MKLIEKMKTIKEKPVVLIVNRHTNWEFRVVMMWTLF